MGEDRARRRAHDRLLIKKRVSYCELENKLAKDKGVLMDEREEQRRHWEERLRLLEYDEDVLSKAFVPLGQSREESKVVAQLGELSIEAGRAISKERY